MGRRSSKSSPAAGAALPFDTVGMTILPGRSLPEWAEPATGAQELAGPELIADAPPPAHAEASVHAPAAADAVPQEWAAAAEQGHQPAMTPEPAFAMAGAAHPGAPAGHAQPNHAFPTEPARYPAAPAAGIAAMAAPTAAATYAPGPPPGAAPAYGQGWPTSASGAPTATSHPGPAMAAYGADGPSAPAGHNTHGAGGTATAYAPQADTRTSPEPVGAQGAAQATQPEAAAPPAPSTGWTSPERPELSPEHVALLSWWADMIAAGQFPAPAGTPGAETSTPVKPARRSFPLKAAAVSLAAVAAVGTAAVLGFQVLTSDEPAVVPATEVTLPAAVGSLVAITDPAVGTELQTLLGFGLRPAGVTVTGAYGTAAAGPLALAAMATTMGAPADAVGQIASWAERTGATVTPSVAGTGANEGITCAAVEAIPTAQPGSFCVWSASGKRGQTYAVATSVEGAQALTNEIRASVTSG